MKFLPLILLLCACSILQPKDIASVKLGTSEKQVLEKYKVLQTREIGRYKFITIYDGILVTDNKDVVFKSVLQHPYDYSTQVNSLSIAPELKHKYFLKADPRSVDPKSISFPELKKQVEVMLKINGQTVVSNEKDSTATLHIGYAVTGKIIKTFSQGTITLREDISYHRFLLLSASENGKGETNLWETKVESTGPNNDLKVFMPGLITAAGLFLNKNSEGAEEVVVPGYSVVMNIVKNPKAFEKFLID